MSNFRITNRMMVDLGVQRMNDRLAGFERAQRDLATGKRIHVASDDVAGMSRALGVRSAIAANAQARKNAEDGQMWINLADSRLGTVTDQLQRARELVITARTATAGADGRQAVAVEIGQIADSVAALANSRHQGRSLFGGFASANPVAKVGGVWTYQGDGGSVERRVGENEKVAVNVTGDQVFGFTAGEDLFTLLETIQTQATSNDVAGMGASLDALDRALDRVLSGRAQLGSAANRLEQAVFRSQTDDVNLRTVLSETEDTDFAQATMELQMQQVAYQAAQGALAKTLQPSLATFLQ